MAPVNSVPSRAARWARMRVPATGRSEVTTPAAPGAPPFSPSDLTGLKGWWDFSDITKLWQDAARTSAVTTDGQQIGAVDDKSGNGKHATRTASAAFLYKTGIQNGLSCVLSDASENGFAVGSSIGAATTMTMFCVVKATANGGKFLANGSGDGAMFNQNVTKRDWLCEGVVNQDDGDMSHIAFELWVGTVSAAPLWVLRVNAVELVLASNTGAIIAPTNFLIGGAPATRLTGYIAECGIYDSVLSAGNITSLETYLNSKWSVF